MQKSKMLSILKLIGTFEKRVPGLIKRATCTTCVAKRRTTLYFLQQLFATRNNLICCKTGLNVGGKTRNIVIQLVLQQCCKKSCTFLSAVLSYL